MARRKGKKRGGGKRLYIAPLVGTIAYAFAVKNNWDNATGWNPGRRMTYALTGWDAANPQATGNVIATVGPIAAGVIVHKGAAAAGLNRMLPKGVNL